jgi:hypothetical protein
MSLVGRRIRKWNEDEGVVREVSYSSESGEWYAMVRRDDGRLECWQVTEGCLGCIEIDHKPAPYVRPPPTSMPGPGEPR